MNMLTLIYTRIASLKALWNVVSVNQSGRLTTEQLKLSQTPRKNHSLEQHLNFIIALLHSSLKALSPNSENSFSIQPCRPSPQGVFCSLLKEMINCPEVIMRHPPSPTGARGIPRSNPGPCGRSPQDARVRTGLWPDRRHRPSVRPAQGRTACDRAGKAW